LNCVARQPEALAERADPLVITPHPKELARLTGWSVEEIQKDRIGTAREAALRFGCTVVLKGAHSLVTDGTRVAINLTGTEAMATAGTGDVLAGCIATLLAQGLAPFEAACCGAHLHGLAGELAAQAVGGIGMVAGDMAEQLPRARARLMEEGQGLAS
jgi:NAD(P)H-hydrate epimerase